MSFPSFLKLPFLFLEDKLLEDLVVSQEYSFAPHFNAKDYHGSWTSIALRSVNGSADAILTDSPDQCYRDTPLLNKCGYLPTVLDQFLCEKESVRLLSLAPGSVIKPHTDPNAVRESHRRRVRNRSPASRGQRSTVRTSGRL